MFDKDKDRIYGLTLMPPFVAFDDIKAPFYEKMKELNFFEGEQFEYSSIEYKSNPVPIMTEFVNHNHEHYFDFVIFLNNPKKCETQKKDSNTFKYIKLLSFSISCIIFIDSIYSFRHGKNSLANRDIVDSLFLL